MHRAWYIPAVGVAALLVAGPAGSEPACELGRVERSQVHSPQCMGCHDGSGGPAAHAALFGADVAEWAGEGNHPVEVDQDEAAARDPQHGVFAAELPPSLPLREGKVTCATCHDASSPHPHQTAITMQGSALCFACHRY